MTRSRGRPSTRHARLAAMTLLLAGLVAPVPTASAPVPAFGPDGASNGTPAAAPGDAEIRLVRKAGGLTKPVFLTPAGDGTGRLFIVEQTGRIKILTKGSVLSTPFLSIPGQVSDGYEQGLLGLAFHPNYETNRKLYVNFTDNNGDTIIREYRACATNPNRVCTDTARLILKIYQPQDNHNGGMLAFGPDGYLYIGMGDGGGSGDSNNYGQRLDTRLGKMLRIDVNGTTASSAFRIPASNPFVGVNGLDTIWQYGLRNPWRWSFDRANGDMWIADVGQGDWEEINRADATASGAGRGFNWGWRVMEGTHCFNPGTGCNTSGKQLPIVEYGHSGGRCAVTGGYVYRGSAIPVLVGGYVFADYCSGEIWVIDSNASAPASKTLLLDTGHQISGFGQGPQGELYVMAHGGAVYRIEPL